MRWVVRKGVSGQAGRGWVRSKGVAENSGKKSPWPLSLTGSRRYCAPRLMVSWTMLSASAMSKRM